MRLVTVTSYPIYAHGINVIIMTIMIIIIIIIIIIVMIKILIIIPFLTSFEQR